MLLGELYWGGGMSLRGRLLTSTHLFHRFVLSEDCELAPFGCRSRPRIKGNCIRKHELAKHAHGIYRGGHHYRESQARSARVELKEITFKS